MDRDKVVIQINPIDRWIVRRWRSYQSVFPNDKEKTVAVYKCCYRVLNHVDGQVYRFEDEEESLPEIRGEEWTPIEFVDGYDCSNFAEVSTHGRVRFAFGKKLSLRMKTRLDGNVIVKLKVNGNDMRDFYVHRLVANAFIPHPLITETMTVKHLDGNKSNNFYQNLKWCDKKAVIFIPTPQ